MYILEKDGTLRDSGTELLLISVDAADIAAIGALSPGDVYAVMPEGLHTDAYVDKKKQDMQYHVDNERARKR